MGWWGWRRLQSTLYSGQYHGECTNHAVLLYSVQCSHPQPCTTARTVRSVNLDRPGGAEPADTGRHAHGHGLGDGDSVVDAAESEAVLHHDK